MYKKDIEINAGVIQRLLAGKGAMSVRQIQRDTKYTDTFVALTLGWLARENKIRFFEKQEALYIELMDHPIHEMYF